MNETALVRTENLCKNYPDGQVAAVVDANLSIHKGEFVAIMGPSGSGKSTLLNLIGALDRPSKGEIYFEGQPVSGIRDLDGLRSRKIGFVFQSFYLLPTLTALENVQIPMFEGKLSIRERVGKAQELLHAVGLDHRLRHLPKQLSVGERQRVAIARALANDPILLLADEPTGNLDSHTAADVLDLFDRLHHNLGLTIVMVTHGQEVADRAQRIIRMRDGRVVIADDETNSAPGQIMADPNYERFPAS
jgi:putative ABC transport system ATP-binding protein